MMGYPPCTQIVPIDPAYGYPMVVNQDPTASLLHDAPPAVAAAAAAQSNMARSLNLALCSFHQTAQNWLQTRGQHTNLKLEASADAGRQGWFGFSADAGTRVSVQLSMW